MLENTDDSINENNQSMYSSQGSQVQQTNAAVAANTTIEMVNSENEATENICTFQNKRLVSQFYDDSFKDEPKTP